MTTTSAILAALTDCGALTSWELSGELAVRGHPVPHKLVTAHIGKLRQRGLVVKIGVRAHPGDRRGPREGVYGVEGCDG